jgi:predicted ester cyclase
MQSFYTSPVVKINDESCSPEKVTAQFKPLVTAFPDWRWEMRHLAVDGDYLALHFTVSGTHKGELNGYSRQDGRFLLHSSRCTTWSMGSLQKSGI